MFEDTETEGQRKGAEKASPAPPARRARKGAAPIQTEGHRPPAEQARMTPPSPRVRKRRADKSSVSGHPAGAEQASPTPPDTLDTNRPAEGQRSCAEQAKFATPSPLDTIVARLTLLQRKRKFAIQTIGKIERSCEGYLALMAGYRPKTAEDGSPMRDAEGNRVEDKAGKALWKEVRRVRTLVEKSGAEPARAGRCRHAEQANKRAPARDTTMAAEEGQRRPAEKASNRPPSLPSWADPGLILSTAMSTEPWKAMRKGVEAEMESLAKQLPVWSWWSQHRGTGAIGLAIIVGESGDLGSYRDKSALWKRLGLAVIDGERQQRKRGEDGIRHGYSPRRRAEIWTIADSMLRAQWAGAKDEDGKPALKTGNPVATPAHALGPYGEHYGRRKAYVTERERGMNEREPWSPKHINDDAKRYMTKALIRDLRAAWKAAA